MVRRATKVLKIGGDDVEAHEEYYLNNTNLPKGDSIYEYTPFMIDELTKCRNDIVYFAENYFYINGMNGKEIIKLFGKQRQILQTIQANKKNILLSSRQYGKCFSGNTRITIKHKFLPFKMSVNVKVFFKFIKLLNYFKKLSFGTIKNKGLI